MRSEFTKRYHSYIALGLGMTSFGYDAATGKYVQRPWMQVIAVVSNIFTISSLPLVVWQVIRRTAAIQWNPIMIYTTYASKGIRILTVVYTIVNRPKIDRINSKVLNKYISLKQAYLNHMPRVAEIERSIGRLLYVKVFVVYTMLFVYVMKFLASERGEWTWMTYLGCLMALQTMNILQVIIFNYFFFLWSICYGLKYGQWHIDYLMEEVRDAQRHGKYWRLRMLVADAQRILEMHWQLAKQARMVNLNYRFILLAVLVDRVSSIMLQLYYGAIFTFDHRAETFVLVVWTINFLSMTFDMYLIFLICDLTVNTYYACVDKLRRTCEMNSQSRSLKQMIEKFLLRILNNDFRLDLCGLILINKQTWMEVMQQTAYNSLTLVQFHMILNSNKNFN